MNNLYASIEEFFRLKLVSSTATPDEYFCKALAKLTSQNFKHGLIASAKLTPEILDLMIAAMKLYFERILTLNSQKQLAGIDSFLIKNIDKLSRS